MKYLWSDVWLLQAIIYANIDGEGSLDRIMEMADGLNKTPIADDELESGLVRLTEGGLITEHNEKFLPTENIPQKFRFGKNPNKVVEREDLEEYLNAER